MVKIIDQGVPGELRARYDELISPTDRKLTVQTKVRTRKAVKKTKTKRQRTNVTRGAIYARTVQGLAYSFGRTDDTPENRAWRADRLAELLAGVVNLDYWKYVYPTDKAAFACYPTYYNDPNPKPYQYRTPDNLPTIAVYSAGDLASYYDEDEEETIVPPLNYAGSTEAGRFKDDALVWHVYSFATPIPAGPPDQYPILISPTLNITATCDRRGSRPMFSYIWKFHALDAEPAVTEYSAHPLAGWKQAYYRYKPPLGVAPYYYSSKARHDLIVPFRGNEQTLKTWYLLRLSLRPMRGQGFNNNTQVGTTATADVRLLVPKQTPQNWRFPCFNLPGTSVRLYNANMTTWVDWDLSTCTRPDYEGLPNYGDKIDAHIGGVVTTTNYAIIGSAWRDPNRYVSYANNVGVEVLGSWAGGSIFTEGPYPTQGGGTRQTIYRAQSPWVNWIMAADTPEALAGLLAKRFVGGFSNDMVLDADGVAYNKYFSSITHPAIEKNSTPALIWNDKAYMQDARGYWWRFAAPIDNGGTWGALVSGSYWVPEAQLGAATPQPGRAWPCALGIMMPRPFGSETTHWLLTWEGALRTFTLAGANDSDYLGTV